MEWQKGSKESHQAKALEKIEKDPFGKQAKLKASMSKRTQPARGAQSPQKALKVPESKLKAQSALSPGKRKRHSPEGQVSELQKSAGISSVTKHSKVDAGFSQSVKEDRICQSML